MLSTRPISLTAGHCTGPQLEHPDSAGPQQSAIKEWLTGRKQRVVLNGHASIWEDVWFGVPQELFIIYINDIKNAVDVTGYVPTYYADDTKHGMIDENEANRVRFQNGIDTLQTWSEDWQRLFNVSKCKILHRDKDNQEWQDPGGGGQ